MPIVVIFGFFLTIFVFISFIGLCLYICYQCCCHRGSSEDERHGNRNGETTTTTRVPTTMVDPEERNRQIQMAMEKLTKPSAYYDCEENNESPSTSSECTICLEDLGEKVSCRVFPNCKHIFHTHCIINWLEINQTCPICRTQL